MLLGLKTLKLFKVLIIDLVLVIECLFVDLVNCRFDFEDNSGFTKRPLSLSFVPGFSPGLVDL